VRAEVAQVHAAAVELSAPHHSTRQRPAMAPESSAVLPGIYDAAEPSLSGAAVDALDEVERDVQRDATQGHRRRKAQPEVPELIANAEAQDAGAAGASGGCLAVLEDRGRDIADIPPTGDEADREVQLGHGHEVRREAAARFQVRLTSHEARPLGEEERRQARGRNLASPRAQPPIEGPHLVREYDLAVRLHVPNRTADEPHLGSLGEHGEGRLNRARTRVRVVVEHDQELSSGGVRAEVAPGGADVAPGLDEPHGAAARADEVGRTVPRGVVHDDHLVDRQVGQTIERVRDLGTAPVGQHDGAHARSRHRSIVGSRAGREATSNRLPPLALAYHGVADVRLADDPYGLFVRPRDLHRQIRKLRAWGYRLTSFGEFARLVARGEGRGLAVLTFDDGFADNLHTLLPLLHDVGAPATVFVVSGWLGRPHPYAPRTRILTADEVRELHAGGVEIGCHTVTHPDLTALSPSGARSELERGRQELEAIVESPVRVAAYPFGLAGPDTIAACADAGLEAACRTSGAGSWSAPLNLPRQDMDNGCTLLTLRLKRANRYEPLMSYRLGRGARRLVRLSRRVTR
jgi:peptidoglycan/xylan/chitin deacetylase (PgdA/CDA1 family)